MLCFFRTSGHAEIILLGDGCSEYLFKPVRVNFSQFGNFRFGFLGINDVPLATTFAVLVVFIVAFYLLCWSLIQRGRGLRS